MYCVLFLFDDFMSVNKNDEMKTLNIKIRENGESCSSPMSILQLYQSGVVNQRLDKFQSKHPLYA